MPLRPVSFLLILLALQPARAQPPAAAASRVRDEVARIAIGSPMTVTTRGGRKLHGHLSAIATDSFTLREVDLQQTLEVRYADVEKIGKDYGRKGFGGRRVNPHKRLLISALVIGGLITLVFVAVASDRS